MRDLVRHAQMRKVSAQIPAACRQAFERITERRISDDVPSIERREATPSPVRLPGAAVAVPGRDTRRPIPEGVNDDDEPDEGRDRRGQEWT
jgi:hypothetical protein